MLLELLVRVLRHTHTHSHPARIYTYTYKYKCTYIYDAFELSSMA
jgi:hypothetical protein